MTKAQFITLTTADDERITIKVAHIVHFVRFSGDPTTRILESTGDTLRVIETPDEIVAMFD